LGRGKYIKEVGKMRIEVKRKESCRNFKIPKKVKIKKVVVAPTLPPQGEGIEIVVPNGCDWCYYAVKIIGDTLYLQCGT
jgi:hypothetical protein